MACGNKAAKRDLTRIVATQAGDVEVDTTGKSAGRGAYVCADGRCDLDRLKKDRLEHALRVHLTDDDLARIIASVD